MTGATTMRRFADERLRIDESEGALCVSAPAGDVTARSVIGLAFFAIWSLVWTLTFIRAILSAMSGEASNPVPTIILTGLATALGVYCIALCLYVMFGRERLTVTRDDVRATNPWTFGLTMQRFGLDRVAGFTFGNDTCGVRAEAGCCCTWSADDDRIALHVRGSSPLSVFHDVPPETGPALRDRLNDALRSFRGEEN